MDKLPYKNTYTQGMILSLVAAVITGFCPVLQTKCKDLPMTYFMLWSGTSKLIVGLLCPIFGLSNNLHEPQMFSQDFWLLTMLAATSMFGLLFMQMGFVVSGEPLLVSVTRSMEIVMALIVDMIASPVPIDYTNSHIWFKISGALLVMMCVVGIALSDLLEERMPSFCFRKKITEGHVILQEEGNSSEMLLIQLNEMDYGAINLYDESRDGIRD